jgi:putative acetyltransferase
VTSWGYILFVKIKIDHHKSLGLAPLSVIPTHQKLGAGGTLVKEGLKRATELGYRSVIVLGHADYYSKFGFEPARHWNITCPFTLKNDDVFKAIELVPNGLEGVSGTVIYSNEFME